MVIVLLKSTHKIISLSLNVLPRLCFVLFIKSINYLFSEDDRYFNDNFNCGTADASFMNGADIVIGCCM